MHFCTFALFVTIVILSPSLRSRTGSAKNLYRSYARDSSLRFAPFRRTGCTSDAPFRRTGGKSDAPVSMTTKNGQFEYIINFAALKKLPTNSRCTHWIFYIAFAIDTAALYP